MRVPKTQSIFSSTRTTKRVPIAVGVNNSDRSPVLRDPHLNPLPSQGEADAKAPVRVEFRIQSDEASLLCLAGRSLGEGGSRVPRAPFPSLRNQKKLSCVWIFHHGPGRKIGNIDILSVIRCIRTRDHPFPAWDRNSIGQTSFCFFHIRG